MKCQICNENEAHIVFTQIVNNKKIVLQICSECAKKKGLSIEFETAMPHPPIKSFIGELTGSLKKNEEVKIPDLTCTSCGLTFAEFKKTGLFGCDRCHEAFGKYIKILLKQIHGTAVHEGGVPKGVSEEVKIQDQLKHLQLQLQHSVAIEDYERAAKLHDQITTLEKRKSAK